MSTAAADPVLRVAVFARLLRELGLTTTPERVADGCAVLLVVDPARLDEVRDSLRAVFVSRREEVEVFDAAFDLFWSSAQWARAAGSVPQRSRLLPLDPSRAAAVAALLPAREAGVQERVAESSGYSAQELMRQRDFGEMDGDELQAVRRLLRQAPWRVTERRTRRLRPDRHGRVELRRTMRDAARRGGEPLRLARAGMRRKRRPLVILCDVSGSMDRYSRQLLVFAHAIGRRQRAETFAFSTRLTRITQLLRRGDVDQALDAVAGQVHDIGGGTRIADSLHEFHRAYGRRVLGHGAVVMLISDGWDRGEPAELAREMARLHRSCHRLIWLNPLLGSRSYRPETRGMQAALPHCDDFLAAHSLDALDELGRLLASLPRMRGGRSGGGPARRDRRDAAASPGVATMGRS
ncbi:MAG TPA: VWA domain-containing protein [Candidatus Binatia bacterium]|nr:VWA domain-containing protein [Candidatus Binatia bacterium]